MKIRDKILKALEDGAKTNNQLKEFFPNKSMRIISATISNNPSYFIRLEKGYVGLKNRDEHLITGRPIKAGNFKLYMKIANLLVTGERRLQEIYDALPEEKQVSIRATINMRPDLFVRVAIGVIGRAGRDEYLINKYKIAKESIKVKLKKSDEPTIKEKLEKFLSTGEKTLEEIYEHLPEYQKNSITSKLSNLKQFVKVGRKGWKLQNYLSSSSLNKSNNF